MPTSTAASEGAIAVLMFILAPLLAFLITWAYASGMNHLGLRAWRNSDQLHWSERARILFPARNSAVSNIWFLSLNCALATWLYVSKIHPVVGCVFVAAFAGAILGTYPFDRALFPQFTIQSWLRYVVVLWSIQVGFWAMLGCATAVMPWDFTWPAYVIGGVALGLSLALQFGLWIWLLKESKLLFPAPRRLEGIVLKTSQEMQTRYHSVLCLRSPVGYAAALPVTGDLLFSEAMLSTHTDNEIAAIAAHEMAHLTESRWTVGLRLLMSLWAAPIVFIKPVAHTFGGPGVLLLMLPGLIRMAFSKRLGRRLEVRADSTASQHQEEAGVYAQALERLYEMNHMPAVMPNNKTVHPHLYDRLLAAGMTPAYPRPAKPETLSWHGAIMRFVFWVLLFVALGKSVSSKS